MITFLLILIVVFIGVDLLVRFVIEPWITGIDKKARVAKSYSPGFVGSMKLAGETMYDGGKPHKEGEPGGAKEENNTPEAGSEVKQ